MGQNKTELVFKAAQNLLGNEHSLGFLMEFKKWNVYGEGGGKL